MVYKRDTQPATKHCELEFEERAYNYLRLTTNENGEYSLEYSFDTCGGNVTNSHQIIRPQKHEHLDVYANNMNCVWYVTAPADHSIVVRFKYFNMEERRDHLSVYSGHAILGEKRVSQLSGNLMDTLPTIIVDHNQAVINAISDSVIAASGFEGQIVFIPNCNERISLTDGNSPVSLARNYATSRDGKEYMCLYRINAPKGYRIRTDIKKLDINDGLSNCSSAENGQCTNDSSACNFVEVFDSVEVKQPSMGKFCNAANTTLFSSYNDAMLKFIGAQERSYSFEIILTMEKSECGTTDVYTLGVDERYTITMPQNHKATYSPNLHCTWRFKISRPVLLRFNYIDLQNVSQISGECLDYIRVNRYYNFHQLCGHSSSYLGYEWGVVDKKFEITFHSDATEEAKGFQLVIEPISVCGQTYSHPNGLLDYLYSVKNCQTNVTVAENTNLNFYIWDIMFGDPNEGKHYKIVDLKTNTTVFHRSEDILKPVAVFLNTSTVQIEAVNVTFGLVFYSISQRTSIPGCGGTYTLHRGLIISPNYENERMFTNCSWIIQVPAPNSVKIKFLDFNMGTIANCHLDYLQMYDIMPDGSEQPLKTLCGPDTPREIIKSSSNVVRLISKTTPNFDGSGWSLSYNIV
ncbi:cubilin homolog [Musca domestica]|uniref:Cubilin homolog n=1 Tax=Musca domestica TaxID=7370 RepID=A0ABM3VKQ0_MUSDO|nr:cubilin homolog [Musca domestica]